MDSSSPSAAESTSEVTAALAPRAMEMSADVYQLIVREIPQLRSDQRILELLEASVAEGAKLHKIERGDFAPEFPLERAIKDVDLAIAAAGDDELPLLAALSRQWRGAVDAGHGREDVSAARLALGGR